MEYHLNQRRSFTRYLFALLALLLICETSFADETCNRTMRIVDAAQTEFEDFIGEPMEIDVPDGIEVFKGTLKMNPEGVCSVAIQSPDERRFSTSYTCSIPSDDVKQKVFKIQQQLEDCLEIENWIEQSGGNVAFSTYGLFRISISQNDSGLGLGVEVFRDNSGEIAGSSYRGDKTLPDGRQRCTPKSHTKLKKLYDMYAGKNGAEPFDNDQFFGVTNDSSSTVVAFLTKPNHPAHPALITRSVFERDGNVYMSASGDFAGDCLEFHNLLGQVKQMNDGLKQK